MINYAEENRKMLMESVSKLIEAIDIFVEKSDYDVEDLQDVVVTSHELHSVFTTMLTSFCPTENQEDFLDDYLKHFKVSVLNMIRAAEQDSDVCWN